MKARDMVKEFDAVVKKDSIKESLEDLVERSSDVVACAKCLTIIEAMNMVRDMSNNPTDISAAEHIQLQCGYFAARHLETMVHVTRVSEQQKEATVQFYEIVDEVADKMEREQAESREHDINKH